MQLREFSISPNDNTRRQKDAFCSKNFEYREVEIHIFWG